MEQLKRRRVAVVGSGMAGLVTAYMLNRDPEGRFEVEVFETGMEPSLDSATFSIHDPLSQCERRIDLPMRAFAGGFYEHLKAMYDYLDVRYQPQPFLFSFAKLDGAPAPENGGRSPPAHFIHSSNNHRIPPVRPPQRDLLSWILQVVYVSCCYAWFTTCCFLVTPHAATRDVPCESLHRYLRRIRLPRAFISDYLLPLICSVSTCPHDALLNFPACDVIQYKKRTNGAQHYVISDGVNSAQRKLTKGLNIRFGASVTKVEPLDHGVRLTWREKNIRPPIDTHVEEFNAVILAVSPDVIAKIFTPLRNQVSQIPTTVVESVVQLDSEQQRPLISSPPSNSEYQAQTIYLNSTFDATESVHSQPPGILVTTCPIRPIPQSRILHRASFTRVLRTPQSRRIVNGIFGLGERTDAALAVVEEKTGWRNGDSGVSLVGGWCWDGMVLLEGCVVSAERVARQMGVEVPWEKREEGELKIELGGVKET